MMNIDCAHHGDGAQPLSEDPVEEAYSILGENLQ